MRRTWMLLALLAALATLTGRAAATVQVDSIGTTDLDAQNYGPVWQRIYNLPGTGIYVSWVKSGMYYTFYDYSTSTWLGETGVFTERDLTGSLDVDEDTTSPHYGSAFISSRTDEPVLAVETGPGTGTFEFHSTVPTLDGCFYPPIAVGRNGTVHLLCLDPEERDTLLYSRSTDYGTTWSSPLSVCDGHIPRRATHSLASSAASDRVVAVWTFADSQALWINLSSDAGATWTGSQDILTAPSPIPDGRPGSLGGQALFDNQDRLHVVTQLWSDPDQFPAEIWHYRENRDPAWTLVHRFDPSAVLAQAEPQEPFVCRPTIAEDDQGRLFVAWMGYDSINYEPSTQIARADVYVARSEDGGLTWSRPLRATGPDSLSRLSPCLASTATDTLVLCCVEDRKAGVYEHGNGPQTENRVVVLRIPTDELPGVAAHEPVGCRDCGISVVPRPARFIATVRMRSRTGIRGVAVRDCTGRLVGTQTAEGDCVRLDVSRLSPGVYFVTPVPTDVATPGLHAKLVVNR